MGKIGTVLVLGAIAAVVAVFLINKDKSLKLKEIYGKTSDTNDNTYYVGIDDNTVNTVIKNASGTITVLGKKASPRFGKLNGVAIDSKGENIYVTDPDNKMVRKIELSSDNVSNIEYVKLKNPWGIARDNDDNFLITDFISGKIFKYLAAANEKYVEDIFTTFPLNGPKGIAVDIDNNMYIAESGENQIVKIDSLGKSNIVISSRDVINKISLKNPSFVAVDANKIVYLVDTDNNRVIMCMGLGVFFYKEQPPSNIFGDLWVDSSGGVFYDGPMLP
jgi:DNA-binding beta-propeller fold protein YncE